MALYKFFRIVKGIRPVKETEWWDAGVVVRLEQGADLHMVQLMPLPLTVSCFSKIQIGFTFLVPAHLGSPRKRPLNGCVCVCLMDFSCLLSHYQHFCNDVYGAECTSSTHNNNNNNNDRLTAFDPGQPG